MERPYWWLVQCRLARCHPCTYTRGCRVQVWNSVLRRISFSPHCIGQIYIKFVPHGASGVQEQARVLQPCEKVEKEDPPVYDVPILMNLLWTRRRRFEKWQGGRYPFVSGLLLFTQASQLVSYIPFHKTLHRPAPLIDHGNL